MADVAGAINSQVDLLWSVALAMLIAEIFLVSRFLSDRLGKLSQLSMIMIGLSMLLLMVSMFFGYLTYGTTIMLMRLASTDGDVDQSYDDAAMSALLQFVFFGLALIIFIVVFAMNCKIIGGAIDNGK